MSPLDRGGRPVAILMADDDEEDCELTREALQDARLANQMRFVHDGQELVDYVKRRGRFSGPSVDAPRPGVILLDLNAQEDGRELVHHEAGHVRGARRGDGELEALLV